jgi:hypothetical protein
MASDHDLAERAHAVLEAHSWGCLDRSVREKRRRHPGVGDQSTPGGFLRCSIAAMAAMKLAEPTNRTTNVLSRKSTVTPWRKGSE